MPTWARFILFFAVFGTLATLAHVYLYRRLVTDLTERPAVRRVAKWVLIALAAATFLSRPAARAFGGDAPAWIFAPLLTWLGFLLYLFLTVLVGRSAGDAWMAWRRRQGRPVEPERRAFIAKSVAAGAAAMSGGLTVFGTWSAYRDPVVTQLPIVLPMLPKALDGFSIVQVTDVHVGALIQRRFMEELVARVNALRPDLVAVTGDLVDGTPSQLGFAVGALSNLRAPHGTFVITGNHDYYSGANEWATALQAMGLQVLRNRRVEVGGEGASFDLLGVDDWSTRGMAGGYDFDRALAGRRPDRASVLLAHQPTNLDGAARSGIGLQLSGHTHGGQMFPGTGIAQLIWGNRNAGLSRHGNTWLYTSRGCGFVGPPMRVGSPPEIVKVTLLAG